jgi:hypothetical protein
VRGSYLTLASVGVQAHAILVEAGCADIVIERVSVFQSAGDAIRLIGEPDQKVRRVWVQGCRLVQNNRTGVAFQRCVELVWVTDCYIETIPPSTQAGIDFEPSPPESAGGQLVAAADVVIDSNVLLHNVPAVAVSISGLTAAGDPAQRIQFTNNVLLGGVIGGVNAHDVTISGNDITAAGSGIMLDNPGSQVTIDGNRIWGKGQAQGIHIELAGQAGEVRRDMRITGNSVTSFADAGIQISINNTDQKIDGWK